MDLPPPTIDSKKLPEFRSILCEISDISPEITLTEFTKKLRKIRRLPKWDQETKENNVEHSYGLVVHALYYKNEYYVDDPDIDELDAVKYAIVHDWVEILVGDTVTLGISDDDYRKKQELETQATVALVEFLKNNGLSIFAGYLEEYEKQATKTARFVKAVDKLEPALVVIVGDALTPQLDHGIYDNALIKQGLELDQARFAEKFGEEFPELAEKRSELTKAQKDKATQQAENGYYMI